MAPSGGYFLPRIIAISVGIHYGNVKDCCFRIIIVGRHSSVTLHNGGGRIQIGADQRHERVWSNVFIVVGRGVGLSEFSQKSITYHMNGPFYPYNVQHKRTPLLLFYFN